MVHIGLMVYSISFFSLDTIIGGFFYLMTYIILMLFIFLFMFFLFEKNTQGIIVIDNISQISTQISHNYILSVFFIFILFSLAGLPFFIGFIAK
jgi:NADH:ubiquinone oxidoreductase subunit 2 (subunit N)